MLRASGVLVAALLVVPGMARAGNSDDVVAGSDVALTGGAVVANVHTGGAMWFNPAGVARLDARSVDLTGAVLSYNIISAPGVLSLQSGEQSEGDFSALQAIPRALTFVASPRPALRWGIGFFFSRSLSRFLQDSVSTQSDSLEPSEFYATADETKSVYHLSSALAWKKSDKFLLGGGFDIVVATQRLTEIISGAYGVSGADGTGTHSPILERTTSTTSSSTRRTPRPATARPGSSASIPPPVTAQNAASPGATATGSTPRTRSACLARMRRAAP